MSKPQSGKDIGQEESQSHIVGGWTGRVAVWNVRMQLHNLGLKFQSWGEGGNRGHRGSDRYEGFWREELIRFSCRFGQREQK